MAVRVLAVSGSARKGSLNQKLLNVVVQGALSAGAEVTVISLSDYPLPFFDSDLEKEQGVPLQALRLQKLFSEHDALLVASPDYNGGYTALLKNAIDWMSRPTLEKVSGLALFANKATAVISASPGPMGGIRSMLAMRGVLERLGAVLIPQTFTLGVAHQAFAENGQLADAQVDGEVKAIGATLVRYSGALREA
ncbi:FMN reductase [Pseudomonas agarici]|uniref:FMN reductase n=1 Tax=Pseudomonas agarici TaxID=46677 RepID=A0A0X1SZC8_PSEAA|nr:NAD(P)H-dependent oxidoreductase [Pseudomonas agarici]AMB85172.1 FMN reductase [Pseudomonas agarici]NWB94132.1 NAD(P)H-dependent oxidoreductase [Pseudomonas agarici]NWC07934.1 NAD(P)H-dependent oxidoreductase [Pseudomonas agarici]SEK78306.1 NAD(P)H-dependent FMN reductase [Pseudomonas agarici]